MSAASEPVPRRGPRPSLSRAVVIEAALELIDQQGLAALNLRTLATRLGVSAMTPYSYVTGKAELLEAMAEHALAPIGLTPAPAPGSEPDAGWEHQLGTALRGLHQALERHPGVVELVLAQSETTLLDAPRARLLAVLRGTGLSPEGGAAALRSLTSYVLGYTVLTRMRPRTARRRPGDSFEHGLAMMLDSLRREVERSEPAASEPDGTEPGDGS